MAVLMRFPSDFMFHLSDEEATVLIPAERIENRILLLRGQKVMLDRDLADLYGVRTSILKRAVTRNAERFPDDFMFLLNAEEVANWRCQFGTSNSDRM
jgi:hypothetical protein